MWISANDIALEYRHVPTRRIRDHDYYCPTVGWVLDTLLPWYEDVTASFHAEALRTWTDCDNKSGLLWALAGVAHVPTRARDDGDVQESIAVGIVDYHRDKGGWCSRNVAFVVGDRVIGRIDPLYIDPSGPRLVELSRAETASIRCVIF